MDFLGIYVDGNMLQTFCNMFLVVFALDFISNLAQILRMKQESIMTDFYLWMCNLFVLVAYISEELNVVTRFGSCCCLIGFILSIFMMCESIVVYAERRCGDV